MPVLGFNLFFLGSVDQYIIWFLCMQFVSQNVFFFSATLTLIWGINKKKTLFGPAPELMFTKSISSKCVNWVDDFYDLFCAYSNVYVLSFTKAPTF